MFVFKGYDNRNILFLKWILDAVFIIFLKKSYIQNVLHSYHCTALPNIFISYYHQSDVSSLYMGTHSCPEISLQVYMNNKLGNYIFCIASLFHPLRTYKRCIQLEIQEDAVKLSTQQTVTLIMCSNNIQTGCKSG